MKFKKRYILLVILFFLGLIFFIDIYLMKYKLEKQNKYGMLYYVLHEQVRVEKVEFDPEQFLENINGENKLIVPFDNKLFFNDLDIKFKKTPISDIFFKNLKAKLLKSNSLNHSDLVFVPPPIKIYKISGITTSLYLNFEQYPDKKKLFLEVFDKYGNSLKLFECNFTLEELKEY